MKLSKKILAALSTAALLATAGSFMSCSDDDDDDFNIISGSINDYSITGGSYTNTTDITQRGFETSTWKHMGAIVQIKMNTSNKDQGAMGFLWDFEERGADGYNRASKGARRFCLAGFNYKSDNKVHYYVSEYKDVDDIQLKNFGATVVNNNDFEDGLKESTAQTEATERVIIELNSSNAFTPSKIDTDGSFTVTIVVRPVSYDENLNLTKWNKAIGKYVTGDIDVYILDGAFDAASLNDLTENTNKIVSGGFANIKVTDLEYTMPDPVKTLADGTKLYESLPKMQRKFGPYANVYQGKTLTGSWKFVETYKEDEVVEE